MEDEAGLSHASERDWITVADADAIGEQEVMCVTLGDLNLALYRVCADEWYCTDNLCTHGNAMLHEGWLEDCSIECPLHGGRFDVRTGEPLSEPAQEPLSTYPVRVILGQVQVWVARS
ncbi:non-heme iron oxygenase ferredoxin subunit [Mesorhizobium sp.]|uniref:non-heme iron oxygenase ferredoxin subunit n=1 Tax=Mesorhizobium sp. TaxID=1871066 RepID=UPI000FE98EFB|nr:non-heme iron oxygenase ferredoxin subunit [Mesorhizobium sp.]RWI08725.1 MAG: non-heme iron oxygenase ferredoxin subunit [Mesorhizobium sp.]RWM45508.1 MAG: non-heme iron oxygenase ferredoxin subunit [Mesorhizobium sp.]RWM58172.1 MAG: non-heme iron oxygenase ferredoxin subunit [Mesorhizobium sp.]RWM58663.1 MAG: non-heme iron oxygenase ferredoxin subunit [Mesorhizobium sp.]RWM85644.1 MAG: non-heme iron oxygenase ferredoxin subunit [Mesorhizobium sp.]